ncbi:MAG: deoxyribodipyrimidine photo-lyase [Candidatus Pacebacteria bacterium]|nr:deoxyribodipyrimidine photo-lyase [Candidatus Paceibacterota bacterium]
MARYKRALFVFRRDIRLEDNTALNAACADADEVVCAFVLDDRQVSSVNPYAGEHLLQFMAESLVDVDAALVKKGSRLHVWCGTAEEVIPRVAAETACESVYFNRDYTPFAQARDTAVSEQCAARGIAVHSYDDAVLVAPGKVLTQKVEPYSVFTPFYRAARTGPVPHPETNHGTTIALAQGRDAGIEALAPLLRNRKLAASGGRTAAKKKMEQLDRYTHYADERDMVAEDGTTLLSPYLKHGCVSVREVYWALQAALPHAHEPLTRQLYWRDFFTHLMFFHPAVLGHAFKPLYDRVSWDEPGERFERWKKGETGFPIVDAGMRQLNETGWMHNRARMITASFLVKDLHIDWREGERYFATKLIDYDPAVNNGSWQWVAGTGADAAPYFRIFNPWLQQKKFDPEARYIKRWVPELETVPVEDIHAWNDRAGGLFEAAKYPAPMLDHRAEAEEAKRRFGRALK